MSLGTAAFTVMSEFRFDVAHAIAGSDQLQNAVGRVSDAANGLIGDFQRVSMGVVASMGLGSGGVLGFLYSAVQASDKFGASQRKLANIFLSNQSAFGQGGINFQQAMMASEKVMNNIVAKADEFALDPNALLSTATLMGASLFNHGLDDQNLTKSTDLARGLMKSAPTLGVDPMMAQGQLLSAVQGSASYGDTLFQRLVNETSSMKGMDSKKFNSLDAATRVEKLRQALLQFGSDVNILEGNVNSLTGQLTRFKTMIYGQFSIFKEFGDLLNQTLITQLKKVNEWMKTHGKAVVTQLTEFLRPLLQDPQKLYETIKQVANLKKDLSMAGHFAGLIGIVQAVMFMVPFLRSMGLLQPIMAALGGALGWLRGAAAYVGSFITLKGVGTVLMFIGKAASMILAPLIGLLLIFQGISRGKARADVINMSWAAENADKLADMANRWKKALTAIMHPFELAIDAIADIVAFVFRLDLTGNILIDCSNALADFIGGFANFIITIYAGLNAIASVLVEFAIAIKEMDFSNFTLRMAEAFSGGYDEYMRKHSPYYKAPGAAEDGKMATSGHTTNIGKVEINQNFKEQMEPDRIAFSVKDQILKTAQNPTQARGRSFSGNLGR